MTETVSSIVPGGLRVAADNESGVRYSGGVFRVVGQSCSLCGGKFMGPRGGIPVQCWSPGLTGLVVVGLWPPDWGSAIVCRDCALKPGKSLIKLKVPNAIIGLRGPGLIKWRTTP